MIDLTLHAICSYLLVLIFSTFTGNLRASVVIAFLIGFGKEAFIDQSFSFDEIFANIGGIIAIGYTLKQFVPQRARRWARNGF